MFGSANDQQYYSRPERQASAVAWGGAAGVCLGAGRLLGILLPVPSLRFLIRHFDLTKILVPGGYGRPT